MSDASPLYHRIKTDLLSAIDSQQYLPDARLPSEHELCERYGVSRTTVRQALGELLREGVIYKQHGRGTFVARPRPVRDVGALQGLADARGQQGLQVSNRLHSYRELPADARMRQRLALPAGSQVAELSRLRLLDGQPISLEITWCERSLGERLMDAGVLRRDLFTMLEDECGLGIGHADMQLGAVGADPEQAALLQLAEGAPLLRIERLVHDDQGRPLLYEHLYLCSDQLDYRLRVERRR